MSLQQLARHIDTSSEQPCTKRFKTEQGTAAGVPQEEQPSRVVSGVNGGIAAVQGFEPVDALEKAHTFSDAVPPVALSLLEVPPANLHGAEQALFELLQRHEQTPVANPGAACIAVLEQHGVHCSDFECRTLRRWAKKPQSPQDSVLIYGHMAKGGSINLSDSRGSLAGQAAGAALLALGVPSSDTSLVFDNVVPYSNEEVAHRWPAEPGQTAGAARAALLGQLLGRLEVAQAGGAPGGGGDGPGVGQPGGDQAARLQRRGRNVTRLPRRGWRHPKPRRQDVPAARAWARINLLIMRICGRNIKSVVVVSSLAAPVFFDAELSDGQVLGTEPPPPLHPSVSARLPDGCTILVSPYPTCCMSRNFVDMTAVRTLLSHMPAGTSLPQGTRQPHALLAAFQHTVVLHQMIVQLHSALVAAGRIEPLSAAELQAAYSRALTRIYGLSSPMLHCMAQPGGAASGLPSLLTTIRGRLPQLATEYRLGEEGERRHRRRDEANSAPPPAAASTLAFLQEDARLHGADVQQRQLLARQRASGARVLPGDRAPAAVGADDELWVQDIGPMPAACLKPGDRLVDYHAVDADLKLQTHEVEAVEAFYTKPYQLKQGFAIKDPKSAGVCDIRMYLTGLTGVRIAHNKKAPGGAQPVTVLACEAEVERVRDSMRQRKLVLCLGGAYDSGAADGAMDNLLRAREFVKQEAEARGLDPDKLLPPESDLQQISPMDLGRQLGRLLGDGAARDAQMIFSAEDTKHVLPDFCRLVHKLGLHPVASQDTGTSVKVLASTCTAKRTCHRSWLLDKDGGEVLDEERQRVSPLSNDPKLNILVQWLLLEGALNGSTRGFQPHQEGRLLMRPHDFLMGVCAGAVETDGSYITAANGFAIAQGRLCGHDSMVRVFSGAALRCGLGGLTHAGAGHFSTSLRGPLLQRLSDIILLPSKKVPAQAASQASSDNKRGRNHEDYTPPDPHLRWFKVEQQDELQLCVRVQLKGGEEMVRTAAGVGLLLGG